MPTGVYISDADFTTSAWVRVFTVQQHSKIMDLGNPGPNDVFEFSLARSLLGNPYIAYNANGGVCECISSVVLALGDWHYLAAVLKGSNMSLYLDGILVGSVICPSQYLPTNVIRTKCFVGGSNWPSEPDADADFDELKIYNRALKYDEIL